MLREDIERQIQQNATRLVPLGGQTGHFLAVVGQDPFQFAFVQVPETQIPRYPGNPDGELSAPIDSLVRNTDDHSLWINTDGEMAWQLIGGAGVAAAALDWAEIFGQAETGLFSGFLHDLQSDGTSNFNGTAISDGTGSDLAEINEDGIYSFTMQITAEATTGPDTYNDFRGWLVITPVDGALPFPSLQDRRAPGLSGNKHQVMCVLSCTCFCDAGTTVEVRVVMTGDAVTTWTFDGVLRVQRLA